MRKVFFEFIIINFLFNSFLSGASDSLQILVNQAIQLSPRIKMLELKKESANFRVIQNSNLPDPMLSIGFSNLPVPSLSFKKEPMTEKMIGLSQEFPFPGKLKQMAESEKKEVEMIELELIDARNEIRKEFIKAYNELRLVRKYIVVLENTKILLKNMLEIVRAKFISSSEPQQNLLKIELELTNVENMLQEKMSMEKSTLAMINSLLFRSHDSPFEVEDFPILESKSLELVSLLGIAKKSSPVLKSLIVAKEKARINESIARYDLYPMFNLSLKYSFRDKIDGVKMDNLATVMLDVSLPLNYGGKVTAKIDETKAMQEFFEQQYQLNIQMLTISLSASISRVNSLIQRIRLIEEGSLIQAQENLKTALTEYQVGKIDFINVIDAQMELLRIENELYQLKTDYLNEMNEIEYLIGNTIWEK